MNDINVESLKARYGKTVKPIGNRALCIVVFIVAQYLPGIVSAQNLTVVNNGGSLGDAERGAFYESFTQLNGGAIIEDNFNQELAKIRAQVDTGNILWDVVSVSVINLETGCEEGLFETIDWSEYLDEREFKAVGSFTECGVPYFSVSGGLVYDADKIVDPPKTWQDFWNVDKWPGKRGLLYRAEQTLEIAIMATGVHPTDAVTALSEPGGTDKAFAQLELLKPHIHWWKSGAEPMQLLASGEVVMTYAWNGRAATANKTDNKNFKIVLDAGHVTGSQYYAIMRGSRNIDLAIKFIQHSTSAKRQADLARRINYAPTNKSAYALMTESERSTLPGKNFDKASLQKGKNYINFWLERGDQLLQRLIVFAAK